MERYLSKDEGSRLYFSYENFVDPLTGPGEAVRLANFLAAGLRHNALEWVMNSMENYVDGGDGGGSGSGSGSSAEEHPIDAFLKGGGRGTGTGTGRVGGVDVSPEEVIDRALDEATRTMVRDEEVPCVWREVVQSTMSAAFASASASASERKSEGDDKRRSLVQDDDEVEEDKDEDDNDDSKNRRRLTGKPPPHEEGEGGGGITDINVVYGRADWNSSERPYTPENLAELSQMLLELMNRWNRHQRLLTIIAVYHREVNRAYLDITGQLDEAILERDRLSRVQQQPPQQQPPQQQPPPAGLSLLPHGSFHVIQASHPNANTASVVASNWLMGLFEPEKDIAFMNFNWPEEPIKQSGRDAVINSNIVTKTNKVDLLTLYKLIRREFDRRRDVRVRVCHYSLNVCATLLPYISAYSTLQSEQKFTQRILTRCSSSFRIAVPISALASATKCAATKMSCASNTRICGTPTRANCAPWSSR